MTEFAALLQQGSAHAWLFIPSAILLGALHGLEPGHSKTMMAAFIIAIRGTVGQAVMLGLAATLSHTAVVWVVALIGLHFGGKWDAETSEPYFQLASAVLIVGVAAWMLWRTRHHQRAVAHEHDHSHSYDQGSPKVIDTGHGILKLEVFEDNVPPRFRLHTPGPQKMSLLRTAPATYSLETERADGNRQAFTLVQKAGYLESAEEIPEPHEFLARVKMHHGNHEHAFDVEFTEAGHSHALKEFEALGANSGYQDPHELAHANDIRRRFANREITNGQILLFGLTGGLIPCPASITILLLCLQLKQFSLGATLVLCFSIGLALTLVASGAIAALSVRHASKRWSGFGEFTRKAPYFSGGLILLVGLYVGYQGWHGIVH
ncbi:MAG: nickel/cobalt efflux protein RcnA [Moraxellaceae bacterium]